MLPGSVQKQDRIQSEARGGLGAAARSDAAAGRSVGRITAVRVLVAAAIGVVLYVGHVAFIPVALALLLSLVLSGPVELLHRIGLPRAFGAALVMLVIVGAAAGLTDVLSEPAQHWFAEAPHTVRVIARKVRPLAQFANRLDDLRTSADNLTVAGHPTAAPAAVAAPPAQSAPAMLIDITRGLIVGTVTVIILTLFLLSGGPPMLARMTSALVSDLNSAHVICVIEKVRAEVGRFYATTALINVGLGLATGCAMKACGMPNPFLWGTLVAVLNFVPYAGPTTSLLLLTWSVVCSTASRRWWWSPVAPSPGHRRGTGDPTPARRPAPAIDPMLVFLALSFGGLLGHRSAVLATRRWRHSR